MDAMKSITYFYRNPNVGFSIERVFDTITQEIEKNIGIKKIYVPSNRALPWSMIQNMWHVFKNRNKKGINHITGDIHYCVIALFGCKTVLTIHDLVFIDNVKNPLKRFFKWLFWLYFPVKLSDEVVCISTRTKESLLKYINVKNVSVIYNPVDPNIKFSPKIFNNECPTILHIGCGWNKNLDRVVSALSSCNKCHLRIIGKMNDGQKAFLEKSGLSYSNDSGLTDEQIVKEYETCDIVSFPSIYEGFGMPIIEGQKTGRPILSSSIEPMTEIGGDSVCFVDPFSVESIHHGFTRIIEDREYREQLVQTGLENVKHFSVKEITSQYIQVYNKLLK